MLDANKQWPTHHWIPMGVQCDGVPTRYLVVSDGSQSEIAALVSSTKTHMGLYVPSRIDAVP